MKNHKSKTPMHKAENASLGKRHNYKSEAEKCIKAKALELGFSIDEIKQIDRLYLKNKQQ